MNGSLGKSVTHAVMSVMLVLATAAGAGETLYDGIVLPDQWPPVRKPARMPEDPETPPYLKTPPKVIPIDVGRQLFVDDFLVQETSLKRTFHRPTIRPEPVHRQFSYSGGVWFDPKDALFKMWFHERGVCLATSRDGKTWTNVTAPTAKNVHSSIVWLDLEETDPTKRYKLIYTDNGWNYQVRFSADGITWTDPLFVGGAGDRSTCFYNPFRKVWVFSIRLGSYGKRARWYWETSDLTKAPFWNKARADTFMWVGADSGDRPHPDLGIPTQLYNLDAVPYESLMLGFFTIWHGDTRAKEMKDPPTDKARLWQEQERPKLNMLKLGYSRDGWHWARPDRDAFIAPVDDPTAWNFGNVQSVGGGVLILGDRLYIYFSGRQAGGGDWNGLAFLRRDGFASMDAGVEGGLLLTRPVTFRGKHLFVNVDNPSGQLQVEVVGPDDRPIRPFTKERCQVVQADNTLQAMTWEGVDDLSTLAGKAVRFRFHLKDGKLYAFWVSPDLSGASHGYVAAGGPGFTSNRDTMGRAAYMAAEEMMDHAKKAE